jgi:hypothetical protein
MQLRLRHVLGGAAVDGRQRTHARAFRHER